MTNASRAICGAVSLLQLACSQPSPTAPSPTAALAAPTGTGDSQTGARVERQYGGKCETVVTATPGGPGSVLQHIEYICRLRHLGITTAINKQTLTFTSPTTADLENTTTYTAANGDQLFATFQGTAELLQDSTVTFEGQETFTGGTGRFAGASGHTSLAGSGTLNPVDGSGVASFSVSGRLTY